MKTYSQKDKSSSELHPAPGNNEKHRPAMAGRSGISLKDNRPRFAHQQATTTDVIQRMPGDYDKIEKMDGKLITVEYKEHAEWVRLKGTVSNVKSTSIYIGGKRFVKNWIEDHDFRIVSLEEEMNEPLSPTVYGTDTGEQSNEIKQAYEEGQRDFDCAYSYHGGKTYLLFRSFPINKGPVRIVYKYKAGEWEGAAKELAQLAETKGVIIHTIMLHELPDEYLNQALDQLVFLGKIYQSHIGISNVEITGLNLDTDLPNLEQELLSRGVKLSVIENKMNPGVPDTKVREYCYSKGIQYLAYGLTGPSLAGGTCGLVPGASRGEFKFLSDPEVVSISKRLNIKPEELRYVIYTWARAKKVSVIARSTQPERRALNKQDVNIHPDLNEALEDFGSGARLYPPLKKYLLKAGVQLQTIEQLPDYIDPDWLKVYYNKAIVEWNDNDLEKVLLTRFDQLKTEPGKNKWKDLSAMREWLKALLMTTTGPEKEMKAADLFIAASAIYITTDDDVELINSVEALAQLVKGTVVSAKIGPDYHKYVSQGNGSFKLQ